MKSQKRGRIVNMSSILGKKGGSGFAVYSAGKLIEPEDIALVVRRIVELPELFTLWNVDVQARDQVTNPL
jgi:NADP-dependent 3-hydroxy acid dehydrogenase YdfG